MSRAFVLMTAMPPTSGHLQLIQFANLVADDGVTVIVNTQSHEPMGSQRVQALHEAIQNRNLSQVKIEHYDKTIEQNPAAPGFWDMWRGIMRGYGIKATDYIVASEPYGQKVADICGARFFPYDIDRCLNPAKATPVRNDPYDHFGDILPEFRKYLRTTVTIFGAESTGKTTLSRQLADRLDGTWLFEYARPYLERTVNEITPRSMAAIWRGQSALQRQIDNLAPRPYTVQDTDLFSTVGYWQFPQWQPIIGDCPNGLVYDAVALKSDLYIITRSNIPFEADPLRYGGSTREGSDDYWIQICERYDLPYVVLQSSDRQKRLDEAELLVRQVATKKAALIAYDRKGL